MCSCKVRQLIILLLLELKVIIRIVLWRQARSEERNKILMSDIGQRIVVNDCSRVFLRYVTSFSRTDNKPVLGYSTRM